MLLLVSDELLPSVVTEVHADAVVAPPLSVMVLAVSIKQPPEVVAVPPDMVTAEFGR